MTPDEIAVLLERMGCPAAQCATLAAQLDKRARQLAEHRGCSIEDALAHLLRLMQQGRASPDQPGAT